MGRDAAAITTGRQHRSCARRDDIASETGSPTGKSSAQGDNSAAFGFSAKSVGGSSVAAGARRDDRATAAARRTFKFSPDD
jgi:hypothetical protein